MCVFYLLQTRCTVLYVTGQKDEHAELHSFVRHLQDLCNRGFQILQKILYPGLENNMVMFYVPQTVYGMTCNNSKNNRNNRLIRVTGGTMYLAVGFWDVGHGELGFLVHHLH